MSPDTPPTYRRSRSGRIIEHNYAPRAHLVKSRVSGNPEACVADFARNLQALTRGVIYKLRPH